MRDLFVGDIPTGVAAIGTYLVQSLSAKRVRRDFIPFFPLMPTPSNTSQRTVKNTVSFSLEYGVLPIDWQAQENGWVAIIKDLPFIAKSGRF
jgi:hypothetical protein